MIKFQRIKKSISELRQDLVSGDWILIATLRGRRPHDFFKKTKKSFIQPKRTCPFENLSNDFVYVIPNKYPAVGKGICSLMKKEGPYQWTDGYGFHEIIITRDHLKHLALFKKEKVEQILRAYQTRYNILKEEECVEYILIFHNHGKGAGASISHPHSQLITLPVIPPDIGRSLKGSLEYFNKNKQCVHCVMIEWEKKSKKRIVFENRDFLAFAPFTSKTAFEIRIFPKKHQPRFETMTYAERLAAAEVLQNSLFKLYKALGNPDYNFFIHTAPSDSISQFEHYHWHIEILPKTAIWAGFEIGTGIEISTLAPESAAQFLRKF